MPHDSTHPRFWTPAQIDTLRQWYADHPDGTPLDLGALAALIGRSKPNVCRKARELGLTQQSRTSVEKVNGKWPSELPKFTNDEDRRNHLSAVRKQWLADNEHPRGMQGKHHTPETIERLRIATSNREAAMTSEDYEARRVKARRTLEASYESNGATPMRNSRMHSRSSAGTRPDLGFYVRSQWEANYARYLKWLKSSGEIRDWSYEPKTFVFKGETRGAIAYTPDFLVIEKDGSQVFHEVKGWMDGPSKTRLKRMAKHYPEEKIIVIGEDEYKAISRWRRLIPDWEDDRRDVRLEDISDAS